jgi:hypothetical protein
MNSGHVSEDLLKKAKWLVYRAGKVPHFTASEIGSIRRDIRQAAVRLIFPACSNREQPPRNPPPVSLVPSNHSSANLGSNSICKMGLICRISDSCGGLPAAYLWVYSHHPSTSGDICEPPVWYSLGEVGINECRVHYWPPWREYDACKACLNP